MIFFTRPFLLTLSVFLFLSLGGCFHPSKSGSGGGTNNGDDGGGGNDGGNTTITCPKDCPWENYPEITHPNSGWINVAFFIQYKDANGQLQLKCFSPGDSDPDWLAGTYHIGFPEGTFVQLISMISGEHNVQLTLLFPADKSKTTYFHTYLNGKFIETGTLTVSDDGYFNQQPIPNRTSSPLSYKAFSNLKEGDSFQFIFDMVSTDADQHRVAYRMPTFVISKGTGSNPDCEVG